jgi:hypothetical protein
MTKFAWDGEVVEEEQHETKPQEKAAEPGTLTLSVHDFSALEERILRAVEILRRERQAHAEAEERAAQAEAKLRDQAPLVEQLQKELNALHAERDQVRQRVERLLGQLDALEL